MLVKEIHNRIEAGFDKVSSNRYNEFKGEELDMFYNQNEIKYLKKAFQKKTTDRNIPSYQDNQKRQDDLRMMVAKNKLVPLIIPQDGGIDSELVEESAGYAILPDNYLNMINSRSFVEHSADGCSAVAGALEDHYEQIAVLEFPEGESIKPFWEDLNLVLGLSTQDSNYFLGSTGSVLESFESYTSLASGVTTEEAKYKFVHAIIEYFNSVKRSVNSSLFQDTEVFWERYLGYYEKDCFIFVDKHKKAIVSIADGADSGNDITIVTTQPHDLLVGDTVRIYNNATYATSSSAVTVVNSTTSFDCAATYSGGGLNTVGNIAKIATDIGLRNRIGDICTLTGTITAFADHDGTIAGTTLVTCTGHGLTDANIGDTVILSGTTNYNSTYTIADIVSSSTFAIVVAFVANDAAGTWTGVDQYEYTTGAFSWRALKKYASQTSSTKIKRANRPMDPEVIYEILNHPFGKTRKDSPICTLSNQVVHVFNNSFYFVTDVRFDYLKKPRPISLSLNITSELPDSAIEEVIALTVEHLHFITGNPNYQASVMEQRNSE